MSSTMVGEFPDRISKIFSGKNILVTGGTGFIGKVFVEKIVRMCPEVQCLYLLVRAKRGKDPQTRLKEYFSGALFDRVKLLHGADIMDRKCKAVVGDVAEINLGLSAEARALLTENVHYIYHIAATVKFDEPLKSALMLNTRGTKYMIELGEQCKQLELFCHVSTAYVHPETLCLEEKVYPPPTDPHSIITAIEHLAPEVVASIEKKLLGNLPNTYTYTKALGEQIVAEKMDTMPVVIVRPSVVVPTWKEPVPGWCDNINGPAGLLIGAGKGVVRSMYCNQNYYADFIPADVLANGMAVVSWNFSQTKEKRVFNFTSTDELQVTWKEVIENGRRVIEKDFPFNGVAWYPGGSIKSSKLIHYFTVFFFQIIPAIFVDILVFCLGYKPFLCRIQRRIIKGYELLEHYANNLWVFKKANIDEIRNKMNPTEKELYRISKDGFDMDEYFYNVIHGARLYILKEMDDTLPAAKRHMKIMWWVDRITKVLALIGFGYYVYTRVFIHILS